MLHGQRPANLMAEALRQRLRRKHGKNGKRRYLDAVPQRGNAMTEFVIIREMIHQRFESADLRQSLFGRGHRGAQGEVHAAELPRGKDAGIEVRSVSEGFHFRNECAIGDTSIKASNGSDLRVCERRGDGVQVAWSDANIAIADNQDVVLRFAHHAAELVYLVAGAKRRSADKQANVALRKISDQLFDDRHSRIRLFRHTEDDFEFRVLLPAKAGVVLVGFAIEPADRLQNAHRRSKVLRNWRAIPEKAAGGCYGKNVIAEGAKSEGENGPPEDFMPHVQS